MVAAAGCVHDPRMLVVCQQEAPPVRTLTPIARRLSLLPGRLAWGRYSQLRNVSHGGSAVLHGYDIKGAFGDGSYHLGSTLDNVR